MGWAALVLFAFAAALLWLAWQTNIAQTSADDRLGSAIYAVLGVACLVASVLLWGLWVSFG